MCKKEKQQKMGIKGTNSKKEVLLWICDDHFAAIEIEPNKPLTFDLLNEGMLMFTLITLCIKQFLLFIFKQIILGSIWEKLITTSK